MWPQRFGQTWSSRKQPAAPSRTSSRTVRSTLNALPYPVSMSTRTEVDRRDDPGGRVEDLGLRQEADVGLAQPRRRQAVAGDQHRAESRLGRELRGERVVDAGDHDRARPGEKRADAIHVAAARRSMAQIVGVLQSAGGLA
jgi:hypothetical protein